MMKGKEKHLLVCDERGITNMNSNKRTYTIGGFAAKESTHPHLAATWDNIKLQLCGKKDVELKWSHFFVGHHQKNSNNPLLSNNPDEWRKQALWALEELFDDVHIFPITTVVQKDRVTGSTIIVERKGKQFLDPHQIFAGTLGQFAAYLKEHGGQQGEIWFDKLGSEKEEINWQDRFTSFYNAMSQSPLPIESQELVKRVNPQIKFIDSESEEFVQAADFVSGVIWAASEGDDWFLLQLLEKYAPGKQRTYGILILEA